MVVLERSIVLPAMEKDTMKSGGVRFLVQYVLGQEDLLALAILLVKLAQIVMELNFYSKLVQSVLERKLLNKLAQIVMELNFYSKLVQCVMGAN